MLSRQKITQHWDKTTRVDNMKVRLVDTNDIIKEKKSLAKKLQELLKRKPLKLIAMFFKVVSQLAVISLRKKLPTILKKA